ncbi:MAG: nucleoside triphosphate pyrophosphatase [Cyanobacteria bacterium P01_F01_bin.42]
MSTPTFVLASQSPARLQLLKSAGIDAVPDPSHFDESLVTSNSPSELVQNLAAGKAQVVAKKRTVAHEVILGCDSVLAVNGTIYGKPVDFEDAIARWYEMRGQVGHLYTGHALIDQRSHRHQVTYQRTDVYFANVSDAQIKAYVTTREPLSCAGCFALDGRGGLFVEKIDGCHSNVIGLSLPLLRSMLDELGYNVTDFWKT